MQVHMQAGAVQQAAAGKESEQAEAGPASTAQQESAETPSQQVTLACPNPSSACQRVHVVHGTVLQSPALS